MEATFFCRYRPKKLFICSQTSLIPVFLKNVLDFFFYNNFSVIIFLYQNSYPFKYKITLRCLSVYYKVCYNLRIKDVTAIYDTFINIFVTFYSDSSKLCRDLRDLLSSRDVEN